MLVRKSFLRIVVILVISLTAAIPMQGIAKTTELVVGLASTATVGEDTLAMVKAFEKENPDIHIKPVALGLGGAGEAKFLAMLAGGLQIDVVTNPWLTGWPAYGLQGILADLTPWIKKDEKEIDVKDFSPLSLSGCKVGGKTLMLPFTGALSRSLLTYNRDLLDEAGLEPPPTDWDDKSWTIQKWAQYCSKLTRIDAHGILTQLGAVDFYHGMLVGFYNFSAAFGGDFFAWDEESKLTGLPKKSAFDTVENLRAAEFINDFIFKYKASYGVPGTRLDSTMTNVNFYWTRGKGGFWFYLLDPKDRGLEAEFKVGVAPLPWASPNPRARGWMSTFIYGYGMVKNTKHPEEAWRFIKWATSKEAPKLIAAAKPSPGTPGTNARISVIMEHLAYYPKYPMYSWMPPRDFYKVIEGSIKYGTLPDARNVVIGYQEVYNVVDPLYVKAVVQNAMPPSQFLKEAQRLADIELQKVAAKYGLYKK